MIEPMTDIPAIARSLTEAQMDALLQFARDGYSQHIPQPTAGELVALDLLDGPGRTVHPSQRGLPPQYIITETGSAVRDHLRSEYE